MKSKLIIVVIISMIFFLHSSNETSKIEKKPDIESVKKETCLIMYETIEKYADQYNIPKHIIYNIAYLETKYKGPYDTLYKHNLGSSAGALGPMQVMPSTANLIHKKKVSKVILRNDIDFNVQTSAKLLSILWEKYQNWNKVCGAYNTGRPIVNKYAKFCTSNIVYWEKWVLSEKLEKQFIQ